MGSTVGAAEGEALGWGVGDATVVNVRVELTTVDVAALLSVTVPSLESTDTTVVPDAMPVPDTLLPTAMDNEADAVVSVTDVEPETT